MLCRWLSLTLVLGTLGCGYTTRALYPQNIQTVAVPIVESNSLRRDVEFQLTKRIVELVEARTPYKVVPEDRADTILRARITNYYKNPFGEDGFDNPRGGVMNLMVRVSWIDRRSGQAMTESSVDLGQTVDLQAVQPFAIDTAQSMQSATWDAVEVMANNIVAMMQNPW